jgi:hypothetical protein
MLRVREEDYDRLKALRDLLKAKGLESVNWELLGEQGFVPPPTSSENPDENAAALTWGFVIGAGAAALAYLVFKHLQEREQGAESGAHW